VVYLFSKHVHDPTLPLATQTLSVRVILHLVDSICRGATTEEGAKQVGREGGRMRGWYSCYLLSDNSEGRREGGREGGGWTEEGPRVHVFLCLIQQQQQQGTSGRREGGREGGGRLKKLMFSIPSLQEQQGT